MKHYQLFVRRIWMFLTILFFGVMTGHAATITYSLKTHVDGRTITGTATLNEGASLQDNMPQDLWRGYTTYKYYSDEALTQEITEAPAEDATVYVDYVFDPPFQMSNDNKTVWNYFRSYSGGGYQRYVYYNKSNGHVYAQENTTVNNNKKIQWAFYGDGYSFHIKVNDSSISNPWLVWTTELDGDFFSGYYYLLALGAKKTVGWQLYVNTASNNKISGGTVCLARPDNNELMYHYDTSIELRTEAHSSNHHFDNKNRLVTNHSADTEKHDLWWYAFFASPVSSSSTTTDIWHVTYKIQKADGTWYDDIVIQKSSSNLTPSFPPPGFTTRDDCEYDYFYLDAGFFDKCEDGYAMPNDCNTILYIKETLVDEYVETPWMTLVLPFYIEDLEEYFGEENAVSVDEYTGVEGRLRESGGESFFTCHLNFTPIDATKGIIAGYPYLFKANHVKQSVLDKMFQDATLGTPDLYLTEVKYYDETHAPGIRVSMLGVLDAAGYQTPNDGLNFYFASKFDETQNDYIYAFIRRPATIPQCRCYFFVTDERTGSVSPLTLSFGDNEFTGINDIMAGGNTKSTTPMVS